MFCRRLAIVVSLAVVGATACAQDSGGLPLDSTAGTSGDESRVSSEMGTSDTVAELPTGNESVAELETGDVDDGASYWAGFGVPGAIEIEIYENLARFVNSSTVVAVVQALGPGPQITLHGDPKVPEDVYTITSLQVRVLEVLSGELTSGQEITITGLRAPVGPPSAAPAILFLRHHRDPRYLREPDPSQVADPVDRQALIEMLEVWREFSADKYQVVNSQGVFVAAGERIANPIRHTRAPDSLVSELSLLSFAELKEAIRSVAGHPELASKPGDFICCEPPTEG